MHYLKSTLSLFIICFGLLFTSCNKESKQKKFTVVATTTMIADLVKEIGKDSLVVEGLMGPGIDPHLYKASEGDVQKIAGADVVFYNGLHLEGKMAEVFENLNHTQAIAIAESIPEAERITSAEFSGNYDPHVWFSIPLWKKCVQATTQTLVSQKPDSKAYFEQNAEEYLNKLDELHAKILEKVNEIPEENRVLVTAHDAFGYFGQTYGFKVMGLQGLSTATEAGAKDLLDLANLIVEENIPAIFVESSVPERTMQALQEAVNSRGGKVTIGGTLYSDALGNSDTQEGNYLGMFEYNINTIAKALKNEQ